MIIKKESLIDTVLRRYRESQETWGGLGREYEAFLPSGFLGLDNAIDVLQALKEFNLPINGNPLSSGRASYMLKGLDRWNMYLQRMGEEFGRTIPWPDNGRQPEGEWLLYMSCPTGAFSLSGEYPRSLFRDMFVEMKNIGAKYVDTVNSVLCFDKSSAREAYDQLPILHKKYQGMVGEWSKQQRIKKLKAELETLNGGSEEEQA